MGMRGDSPSHLRQLFSGAACGASCPLIVDESFACSRETLIQSQNQCFLCFSEETMREAFDYTMSILRMIKGRDDIFLCNRGVEDI